MGCGLLRAGGHSCTGRQSLKPVEKQLGLEFQMQVLAVARDCAWWQHALGCQWHSPRQLLVLRNGGVQW